MSDLTDFLLARIAEDEAVASELDPEMFGFDPARGPLSPEEEHINRHDPARVLAECEAKQRIVAEHPAGRESRLLGTVCDTCCVWDEADYEGPPEVAWPCATLRAIATVYADHEDFQESWRP